VALFTNLASELSMQQHLCKASKSHTKAIDLAAVATSW